MSNPEPARLDDYEDDLLARLYDAEYGATLHDLGFYLDHLVPGPVLELACGTGRLARALAERGRTVVGLDAAQAMIRRARLHPVPGAEWVVADMRCFDLGRQFGNILIPFSGLGFLASHDERLQCLRCCHRHLQPGGLLILDLMSPARPSQNSASPQPPRPLIDPDTGDHYLKSTAVHYEAGRVVIRYTYRQQAAVLVQTISLHPLAPATLEAELEACGLFALESYGDYRSNPCTARSPRLIVVAAAPRV